MNIDEVIQHCFDQILAQSKRPLFVAIAGDSGSGKSYLAEQLKQKFSMEKVHFTYINHDDFLIPRKDREPMKQIFYTDGQFKGKSHWEILENMFRLDLFERVINELRQGECSVYLPYMRDTGEVAHEVKRVCPSDIVIFDTSMMLNMMDFVIRVDVDQEIIIKRKIERDRVIRIPEEIETMHRKVQGYYWERAKPKKPDLIIDNNDFEKIRIVSLV